MLPPCLDTTANLVSSNLCCWSLGIILQQVLQQAGKVLDDLERKEWPKGHTFHISKDRCGREVDGKIKLLKMANVWVLFPNPSSCHVGSSFSTYQWWKRLYKYSARWHRTFCVCVFPQFSLVQHMPYVKTGILTVISILYPSGTSSFKWVRTAIKRIQQ